MIVKCENLESRAFDIGLVKEHFMKELLKCRKKNDVFGFLRVRKI
jgi:hypothetical protein